MHSKLLQVLAVSASVIGIGAAANAQQSGPVDVAKYQYDAHCAVCHGVAGKGDGIFAAQLEHGKAVPSLTELSKKNNGVFPFMRVYETIDGRQQVQAHGTKDMPIWGRDFSTGALNLNPYYDPEAFTRAKILALTEYVYRLQAK